MTDPRTRPQRLEDADELDAFVANHDVALVELFTSGCPKCQAMEPVLGNVARSTGVPVGLVNLGDDPRLVERFEVQSVPALVVFRDGERVAHLADGFVGGDELTSFLADHAPDAVDGASTV
ncbi:thiol reductase thioredoxin [Halobiforma lacisalsi AJ5]|uniref:Thioredoxin n=1 Tax=Natronobacterium lacisalsi AJ5 TaxID=358396 RepID=M0LDJ4_NATLA|nr:thioredoxin family protein [Halobiforma lacisalsi]APW99524.1 thiol reductase thioredoxin [Halobiforma lacisalsi AJ5]EMA31647.1 thioredoxin [Halobiforma lacisalsi AJ5]